jgi:hypothetical protein
LFFPVPSKVAAAHDGLFPGRPTGNPRRAGSFVSVKQRSSDTCKPRPRPRSATRSRLPRPPVAAGARPLRQRPGDSDPVLGVTLRAESGRRRRHRDCKCGPEPQAQPDCHSDRTVTGPALTVIGRSSLMIAQSPPRLRLSFTVKFKPRCQWPTRAGTAWQTRSSESELRGSLRPLAGRPGSYGRSRSS